MIVNGKLNNTVISQLTRLHVSTGLQYLLESQRNRLQCQWRNECTIKTHWGQAGKEKMCLSSLSLVNFKQKSWLRLKIHIPTSRSRSKMHVFLLQGARQGVDSSTSNQAKQSLTGVPLFWIVFIPYAVKLTTSNMKPRPEVEETIWSRNHRSLLTGLLSYLSYKTQSTCTRTALPMVGWVLPH